MPLSQGKDGEAKLAKVIAVTDDVDALVAELKAKRREPTVGVSSGPPS